MRHSTTIEEALERDIKETTFVAMLPGEEEVLDLDQERIMGSEQSIQ